MKTNLLRKIMLACWLAVMASMGTTKAQTYDIIDDKFNNGPIGEVSVTITNKGSDQYPNYQTTYAIKWLRGIQINELKAPSREFDRILPNSQDEKYYYVTRSFPGADIIIDGDYKAQSSYEPITDPQIVCGIFNYFTPNSTRLNDGIIEVSSSVTGAEYGYGSYPLKLDFRTQNPIQIQIKENVKVENFPFEINGANVTCRMEGDGSSSLKTNRLSSVTLNSGNFNLIGQVAGVSRFTMNGGVFTFDGQDGLSAQIGSMFISKGEICAKGQGRFNYISINGNVTISGENQFTQGKLLSQNNGTLINQLIINNGNVLLKEISFNPTKEYIIENGNVTFEKVSFTTPSSYGDGITSSILLRSGSLLMDSCLLTFPVYSGHPNYAVDVEGGHLTVKSGVYQGGKDAFFHVSGASGQIILEGGHYRAGEYNSTDNKTDIIHQTDGKVEILDGTFQYAPICIEKGELAIKGGFFDNGDRVVGVKSEKEFNLWIKDNQADVKISGGDFSEASIYMSPNVNIQPTDLLDEGYLFYVSVNFQNKDLANKNISIQHIESSIESSNEKIIVFFETFNQHEIINIIKYIKKIYPVLNCLILYFCPKGLFGFDVGAICYSESKNVIIGKYFEHYAKETYELSADIQRVSLEEVGYTYKSYQKDDKTYGYYRLINKEDEKKVDEKENEYNKALANQYMSLCL